jgi:2,3-bisphosphoglycerate-independent phosphoglycerate mutase
MINTHRPLALIILDGWGHREETKDNAIAAAQKPNWDKLLQHYPHTLISGSGRCVGLPQGQMGNSEVGHLNMGAGRIVQQDLTRIDADIESGDFFNNPTLREACQQAIATNHAIHILGLLSPGGVHSHEQHIHAMVKLAAAMHVPHCYIHAFLDGRDTPPQSAMASLQSLNQLCQTVGTAKIVSVIGRYYAMDRDRRFERIEPAYNLITQGKADFYAATPEQALTQAYARGETDEFVQATSITSKNDSPVTIKDGDIVIFMNFRSDRAREITQAFIEKDFSGFNRSCWPQLAQFVCLSEYDVRFNLPVAFPSISLNQLFADCISKAGLNQLRIAETEKYAHVTFFFNGGIEQPFPGEDRILIPSPKVATYDLKPEMSAYELTDKLVQEILSNRYDVIICNFANPDMVGHTGNLAAATRAIEAIDACLGRIVQALDEVKGELMITADHGNAEQMYDYTTKQPHTAHTSDPVPFIYRGRPANIIINNGKLSDIAPTMLYLLGLKIPNEMTGKPLLEIKNY